jgi:pimeloyl-ACP methyl ester carboxylesterase
MGLRTPLPPQAPQTEGLADLGSVKLWYWDTGGPGDAVVLLHPGSGSAEAFPYQQPVFAAAGYRVICYSRRGQFKSELGSDSESCFAADDLLALMDHLEVDRFHAVGTALGGYVGLDVALSRPERLQSLVLASSMMGIVEPDYQKTLAELRPRPFGELPAEVREVGPSYRAANPEGVAEWKARHDRAGNSATVRLRNKFTWEALARLRVPTQLMTGDADLWIPPFLLRRVGETIPNSRVVIVPDAGHALQWERPDAFNAAVLDFIGERGRQSGFPNAD